MISYILRYFEHPLSLFFLLKSDGKIKYLKEYLTNQITLQTHIRVFDKSRFTLTS